MTRSFRSEDLRGAELVDVDLRDAHVVRSDLCGVVMRGVDVRGLDLEAPWLGEEGSTLLVNGVDVVPLVEAELDRRFPGRSERRAGDVAGLRAAWSRVEQAWAAALDRVAAMPPGTVDTSVGGEWSFAETVRHLVMATDTWVGRAVLEREEPYHRLGLPHAEFAADGHDTSVFAPGPVPWSEVLEARAGRMALVRDLLTTLTDADLAETRDHPWSPGTATTVLHCLHVVLHEEWEHLRYALRDLDAAGATSDGAPGQGAAGLLG